MTDVHAFIFSAADDVGDNVVDIGVSCRWLTDENVTVESGKGVREWGLNEIKRVKVKKHEKMWYIVNEVVMIMSSQINGVELLMINDELKSQKKKIGMMNTCCNIVGFYICIVF